MSNFGDPKAHRSCGEETSELQADREEQDKHVHFLKANRKAKPGESDIGVYLSELPREKSEGDKADDVKGDDRDGVCEPDFPQRSQKVRTLARASNNTIPIKRGQRLG